MIDDAAVDDRGARDALDLHPPECIREMISQFAAYDELVARVRDWAGGGHATSVAYGQVRTRFLSPTHLGESASWDARLVRTTGMGGATCCGE